MKQPHDPPDDRRATSSKTPDDLDLGALSLLIEEPPDENQPAHPAPGPRREPAFQTDSGLTPGQPERPYSEAANLVDELPTASPGVHFRNPEPDPTKAGSDFIVSPLRRHPALLWDSGEELLLLNEFQATRTQSALFEGGFLYLIADCPASGGVGLMEVQADGRYAHILARKRLEERGELTSEQRLIIYSRRKSANRATELLYQIVPKAWHQTLLRRCASSPRGMVCFDPVSMLHGLLMTLPDSTIHALALRLEDAVLLLAGSRDRVMLARRYVLFGEESHSLRDVLRIARQDLSMLARTQGRQIECIRWLEPMRYTLNWTLPEAWDPVLAVKPWPLVALHYDDLPCWSVLPELISRIPLRAALARSSEAWLRPLEKAEPYAWSAMLLLILILSALAWSFNREGRVLSESAIRLTREAAELEQAMPRAPELPSQTASMVKLGERVTRANTAPPLSLLWNKLAASRPADVVISAVSFHYAPDAVTVSLDGVIEGGLAESQAGMLRMAASLESAGFEVTHRTLNLANARRNALTLRLRYPFSQG